MEEKYLKDMNALQQATGHKQPLFFYERAKSL